MNKILLINTAAERAKILMNLLEELSQKNFTFYLLSNRSCLIKQWQEKNWPANKISLGPAVTNKYNRAVFLLMTPWLFIKILLVLINYKYQKGITGVIAAGWAEKIIATLPAKLLGIKIIWLEDPGLNYQELCCKQFYRFNANFSKIITFNNYSKIQLKNLDLKEDDIVTIQPAIKFNVYQDTIYNKLARAEQKNSRRQYFTLGTITSLDQKQKIENLYQAIKICSAIIPNLQLIIVGEGAERKSLSWLAKKMEIDSLVWLVGEQQQTKKWLDSFDLYLVANELPDFEDYNNILDAMAAGLPVIGPRYVGLEDIVYENKTGSLIENGNSEMLARQIIKLHQDTRMLKQLGKNGQERIKNYFTLDKIIDKFANVIQK